MKYSPICIVLFFAISLSFAQDTYTGFACFKQTGMNYSSQNITSAGFGSGMGARLVYRKSMVLVADMSLLWGNGNALTTLVGAGYQRNGFYTPALFGIGGIIAGQKTELLAVDGTRPAPVLWVAGLRVAPLCFSNSMGMASVLEFGFGIGPMQGRFIEITLLSVGASF